MFKITAISKLMTADFALGTTGDEEWYEIHLAGEGKTFVGGSDKAFVVNTKIQGPKALFKDIKIGDVFALSVSTKDM